MLPDTVVEPLVMAAENDDVAECRETVGLPLVVLHPVGRSEDDLVVPPLGLQMRNEPENRFGLHHHTGLPAEGIIVHMAVFVGRPVPDVVYHDLHQPRPLRPLEDRLVSGETSSSGTTVNMSMRIVLIRLGPRPLPPRNKKTGREPSPPKRSKTTAYSGRTSPSITSVMNGL